MRRVVENRQVEMLTAEQIAAINRGRCPDCNHRGFVLGPRGGASVNIECGNLECLSRFNVAQNPYSHHMLVGHRIEKRGEGGAANWGYPP
jgi:hypothetical protein